MRLATIQTCKGRLEQLKQTLPRLVAEGFEFCHVEDWGCPDGAADWARVIERVVCHRHEVNGWHKTAALNCAARAAIGLGAQGLVFVDADTIVEPGFAAAVRAELRPGRCVISGRDGAFDVHGLTGLLAVTAEDFARVGGYDETFRGWGPEDVEMRLRLYLCGDCRFHRLPLALTRPIVHGDELRDRFTAPKADTARSLEVLLARRVREWGYLYERLPGAARDLRFRARTHVHWFTGT